MIFIKDFIATNLSMSDYTICEIRFMMVGDSLTFFRKRTPTQPPRIHPPQRIRRILLKVDPARQPYRVLLGKPSAVRIIITKQIVVQSG